MPEEKEHYSLIDVAELLGVPVEKIYQLLKTRQVPEPRLRVRGKRLWTLAEILPVSEKLTIQHAFEIPPLKKRGPYE